MGKELGIGGTVELPGGQCSSAANLSDPDLAKAVIAPLRADCLAYESYRLHRKLRLSTPIITFCGVNDRIATPKVMKTWKGVAKGRIEHAVLQRAGHRIAQDCPSEV